MAPSITYIFREQERERGKQKNKELGYVQYIIKTLIDKMSKVIIYKDY